MHMRYSAAVQIGQIAGQSEYAQLGGILQSVTPLLFEQGWDSRVAAARAVREICDHTPLHVPEMPDGGGAVGGSGGAGVGGGRMCLQEVDVAFMAEQKHTLEASAG